MFIIKNASTVYYMNIKEVNSKWVQVVISDCAWEKKNFVFSKQTIYTLVCSLRGREAQAIWILKS